MYYSRNTLTFLIAQVLIEIPYVFVIAVMFSVITYAMLGLDWSATKFFWYLYFMFLSYSYFTYYGMMAVALTPNQQVAAILATFFYQFWNLFSGYIVARKVRQFSPQLLSQL